MAGLKAAAMVDSSDGVGNNRNIRVFILDDHELVRRGLTDLLNSTEDIEVVGEAANADSGRATRRRLARCAPARWQRDRGLPRDSLVSS